MLKYIVGPCAVDSISSAIYVASELIHLMRGKDWYFKASFDKANRTMLGSPRGAGLDNTVAAFELIKGVSPHVRITTDVHECWQVERLAKVVDMIQIPAFLCKQTDLLVECGKHFNKVNIKKGQWLGPDGLMGAAEKVRSQNPNAEVWLTERGTQLGYDKLVVDFTIVDELKMMFNYVILDATHSVQRNRKIYGNQGDVEVAKRYFCAASLMGYDGVFAEVHECPEESSSDKDTQIPLDDFQDLLKRHDRIEYLNG